MRMRPILCSSTAEDVFSRGIVPSWERGRVGLGNDCISGMGESLPNFFRNKRHERMKQPQPYFQGVLQCLPGDGTLRMGGILKHRLDEFEIPVTVLVPEELVKRSWQRDRSDRHQALSSLSGSFG